MKSRFLLKVLVVLMVFSAGSCMTDEEIEDSIKGQWIEVSPVSDRTVLIFSSENRLTRIDGDGNSEEYIYRIDDDSIFLSQEGQEGSSELYFNKTEPGRFLIGNLYVSIPEDDPITMTFERQ